ncbi:DUF6515 family protein [Chitinophaga lutea]
MYIRPLIVCLTTLLFLSQTADAQRRGGRGGARPARQAPARQAPARQAPARQVQRPAQQSHWNNQASHPDRNFKANQGVHGNERIGGGVNGNNQHRTFNNNNTRNNTNINRNNVNRNNINTNRNNIHVNNNNINVNRNVVVNRRPTVVVGRPAYRVYPGRYGYYYHPFVPYATWGPAWHPIGFLLTTMAVTAIVVSVNNQKYHYDQGVYYSQQSNGQYQVVPAPVGAVVSSLPSGYSVSNVDGESYYYYNGAYYTKSGSSYTVVSPPEGAVVGKLPEGAKEVTIDGQKYVEYNGTYYQPVQQNGQNSYEVVAAE